MQIVTGLVVVLFVQYTMLNNLNPLKMTNLELINDAIQKMANKPSEGAIIAAQSIARVLDDALVNKYEIKWKCLPIQGSETVDVVDMDSNFSFICRIYDKKMWNEVFDVFNSVQEKTDVKNDASFSNLIDSIVQVI